MNSNRRFLRRLRAIIGILFFVIQFFLIILFVVPCFGWNLPQTIGASFFILVGILFLAEAFLIVIIHRHFLLVWRQTNLFGELGVEVTKAILMNEDTNTVFCTVLDYVLQIIGNVNSGSVQTITEEGSVTIAAARGFSDEYCAAFCIPVEYAFWYRQSEGKMKEPLIISPENVLKAWRLDDFNRLRIKSVISAPLYVEDRLYGFVNIDSRRTRNFKAHDLEIINKIKLQIEVCLLARVRYERSIAESRADCLTGFHSRSHFTLLVSHALGHAKRYGERLVLAMLDIDGLKVVNDKYGHQTGDLVIIAVSDAIRKETRESDIIGRYGGGRIVALFPETTIESMKISLNRTLERLKANPLRLLTGELVASFSYGFAEYPSEGHALEDLVKIADTNLYEMKIGKKNC